VKLQSALLTDWYQLNMMSSYYELGMEEVAVFEFFIRRLPPERNFLVACGLEQALDYLEHVHFTEAEIEWLAATKHFSTAVLERFRSFRFTGDVYALAEGTVCFAQEPLVRVTAPLPEAQLVESRLINLLHYQTMVASKAARCRLAAGTRTLADFGMRRAHGAEAALYAARAAYIAGFDSTSNVQAAREFDIPLTGTMAHSFVESHVNELDALRAFARTHPLDVTLLIDTYDIRRGAERVVQLAREFANGPITITGVRIDSGDLGEEARTVRVILDKGGCPYVKVVASGGIDEYQIAALLRADAPIDAFGVGTSLTTSSDVPAIDCAYKLQQYAGLPRKKHSAWKSTWPGRKQVHRQYGDDGRIAMDMVSCADEILEGKQLLGPVMQHGKRNVSSPPLAELRRHCAHEVDTLPAALRSLEPGLHSPVKISRGLHQLAEELDAVKH
jgi:nicotinate phosphoribosyltransferase